MIDFPSNPTAGQIFQAAGLTFIWDGVKWKAIAPLPSNNIGRNILHNSRFAINQRGFGPFTTAVYTSDRWTNAFSTTGGSSSVTVGANPAGTAASAFGDENCEYIWANTHTAGTGANDFTIMSQPIEDVRRLSGKTVNLSFWAWCTSGSPKVGIELTQQFGTGGTPSGGVAGIGTPQTVTLQANTPVRFSVPINIPSAAGKTFGSTIGTDYTQVNLWLSAGSTYAARSSNIGFQSNTFYFWGMQLELGNAASPLEKLDPRLDQAACMRFFQGYYPIMLSGYADQAGRLLYSGVPLAVPMRTTPTITFSNTTYLNASALQNWATSANVLAYSITATAAGYFYGYGTVGLSADF